MLEIEVGGARLRLLAQRAAFLPQHGTLLVADAHIGKAGSFRRLGVPVPEQTTDETLQRLDDALAAVGAERIVFLGDLLHSARGRGEATLAAVSAWRRRHRQLALLLVRGNHDRHAGDPPHDWHVECVDGPVRVGPLRVGHEPDDETDHDAAVPYLLAGHVHPAAIVGHTGPGRLRLPCFHFGTRVGLLPAFGAFTGMRVCPRAAGDRIYVVADGSVRALNSPP